jgi:hypothetical protein
MIYSISITRVQGVIDTQSVAPTYAHETGLEIGHKQMGLIDGVQVVLCLALNLTGWILDLFELGLPGSA